MQRASATEREQRVTARIYAPLHCHHAQRTDHLSVGDADDSLRTGD
jgi:hypothetical protein